MSAPQNQHRITEWYLRGFSYATASSGPQLATYNKRTGTFGTAYPPSFLARLNNHSAEIEQALSRIETPAASAVRALLARVAPLAPGLYALGDEDAPDADLEFLEAGLFEDVKVTVPARQIRLPEPTEQLALAKFLVLMFTRSPKSEEGAVRAAAFARAGVLETADRFGIHLDRAALEVIDDDDAAAAARWVGLRHADEWANVLCSRLWWIVCAPDDEGFVVGDSPVVSAMALGHDAEWQPLVGDGSVIVAFPLSPRVALLVSGPLMPVSDLSLVAWVNRTSWRWAEEYVAADSRARLEAVMASVPGGKDATVTFPTDPLTAWQQGAASVFRTVGDILFEVLQRDFSGRYVYRPRCNGRLPGDFAPVRLSPSVDGDVAVGPTEDRPDILKQYDAPVAGPALPQQLRDPGPLGRPRGT